MTALVSAANTMLGLGLLESLSTSYRPNRKPPSAGRSLVVVGTSPSAPNRSCAWFEAEPRKVRELAPLARACACIARSVENVRTEPATRRHGLSTRLRRFRHHHRLRRHHHRLRRRWPHRTAFPGPSRSL